MDFFQAQRDARKRTRWLYVLFVVGVLCMSAAIYFVGVATLYWYTLQNEGFTEPVVTNAGALWNSELFIYLVGGTIALIAGACLYKITALGKGAFTVAKSLGGRRVDPDTHDADERRLLNVVEEMAIASGVPVPDVYLLENEPGINAFAAGFSTSDSVICVTRGALNALKRDELQGVIGHEFSHLLNGDSAINVRMIGLLFGILIIRLIGEMMFRSLRFGSSRSRKNDPGVAFALIGLALIIIGSVGAFFARVLQAAISRQREELADASAVQFTRDTTGLVTALKKIGGYVRGSNIYNPHALETRHMFFAESSFSKFVDFQIFRTHPPIEKRIRNLDPSWNGEYVKVDYDKVAEDIPSPFAPRAPAPNSALQTGMAVAVMHEALQHVGAPGDKELDIAKHLCARLPMECLKASRDPQDAPLLMLGLLLSKNEPQASEQLATLGSHYSEPQLERVRSFAAQLGEHPSVARLSLINLAIPVLRHLSDQEYELFMTAIEGMIGSDKKVSLFEYALRHTVRRHLTRYRKGERPSVGTIRNAADVAQSAATLLSALAWFGSNYDEPTAREAFAAGAKTFDLRGEQLPMKEANDCTLQNIDQALKHYEGAADLLKKNLIFAAAKVVSFDGKLIDREAELLRALGDALDCPIPPFAYQ